MKHIEIGQGWLTKDGKKFCGKNASHENLIWGLLHLEQSRVSVFYFPVMFWAGPDRASFCLEEFKVLWVLRQQSSPWWLLLTHAAGVEGRAKMTGYRFLIRSAPLEVCDRTAGHVWIPQGQAGKQCLLWVFLSTLEMCVFLEGHDFIAIDSTGWSCSQIYTSRCSSTCLAFHVTEMGSSKLPQKKKSKVFL